MASSPLLRTSLLVIVFLGLPANLCFWYFLQVPDCPDQPDLPQSLPPPSPPECRVIFSLNPGRSGSYFLSTIFQEFPNTRAVHENWTFLLHSVATKKEGMEATYQRRSQQVQEIIEPVLDQGLVYAESTLMFGHVLYDVVMDRIHAQRGCRVDIIALRRYMPWVAESYLRPSTGPEFGKPTYRDMQSPWMWMDESKATLTRIPKSKNSTLPWQIRECLYNLIETEARTQWFIRTFSPRANVHIHEFRTEELTTPAGLRRLVRDLGIEVDWSEDKYRELACTPKNLKPGKSLFSVQDIENIYIPRYIQEANSLDIWIPDIPHLQPADFNSTCDPII